MDLFFPLLSSIFLFIIVVGANQATLEPKDYWRTILPHTPIPSAIEKLLQPDVYDKPDTSVNVGTDGVSVNTGKGTSVNVGKGGVNVNTGKGTSVDVGPGGVGVNTGNSKPGGTTVGVGKGGVNVNTGKGTSVNVGNGGVNVNTGNSKPDGTTVGVGKGGVNVNTGKGTSVNVGPGGVGVNTGHSKPGGTTVGVGKGGVNVNTGKGTSVNVGHGGVGVETGPTHKPGGTTVNVGKGGVAVDVKPKGKPVVVDAPGGFVYNYAATDTQLHDDPAVALFFLRQDLHRGKKFTLQLEEGGSAAAGFIPRSKAESVPFSTSELPAILNRFSIPSGSAEAAATAKTLSECEEAPVAGEKKLCATSLESMVDFARTRLGTEEVVAVATEGGSADGERRVYKVWSAKRVAAAGGKGVVACHPEAYPYAVFFCHATAASEVYEVEMAAEGGGKAVKAVAVCHTDTKGWNPEHLAFRVLKVKPGTVPVCHFLPRDHVVWAEKV